MTVLIINAKGTAKNACQSSFSFPFTDRWPLTGVFFTGNRNKLQKALISIDNVQNPFYNDLRTNSMSNRDLVLSFEQSLYYGVALAFPLGFRYYYRHM